jgi:hypothetical protein
LCAFCQPTCIDGASSSGQGLSRQWWLIVRSDEVLNLDMILGDQVYVQLFCLSSFVQMDSRFVLYDGRHDRPGKTPTVQCLMIAVQRCRASLFTTFIHQACDSECQKRWPLVMDGRPGLDVRGRREAMGVQFSKVDDGWSRVSEHLFRKQCST